MRQRDAAIIRLRSRGLKQRDIAAALGITHQAVSQRLQRYPPLGIRTKRPLRGTKTAFTCAQCGKTAWLLESQRKTGPGYLRKYCSHRCQGLAEQEVGGTGILWAIEMRIEGDMAWTTIAKQLGCTIQNVQRRIWKHLQARDLLTVRMLRSIWEPTTSEHGRAPSWAWIQNSARIQPRAEP